VSAASAQQPGHDACARDVSRFCRAQMQDGDRSCWRAETDAPHQQGVPTGADQVTA